MVITFSRASVLFLIYKSCGACEDLTLYIDKAVVADTDLYFFGHSDPKAYITVEETTRSTEEIDNNDHPKWHEYLSFGCRNENSTIYVSVIDVDTIWPTATTDELITAEWDDWGSYPLNQVQRLYHEDSSSTGYYIDIMRVAPLTMAPTYYPTTHLPTVSNPPTYNPTAPSQQPSPNPSMGPSPMPYPKPSQQPSPKPSRRPSSKPSPMPSITRVAWEQAPQSADAHWILAVVLTVVGVTLAFGAAVCWRLRYSIGFLSRFSENFGQRAGEDAGVNAGHEMMNLSKTADGYLKLEGDQDIVSFV